MDTAVSDSVFRELERELFAAHEGTPDLATIDRLYADDFLSTNADGRVVDKQGWLNILKAGLFPVDTITTDDFKVRRYSGTAIITGRSAYSTVARSSGKSDTRRCGPTRMVGGSWSAGKARQCQPRPNTRRRR